MTTPDKSGQAIHLLAAINRLGLKAYSSPNRSSLIFLFLNDTIQIMRYNRASLWKLDKDKAELMGVSGHAQVNPNSFLASQWKQVIRGIENKSQSQILDTVNQIKEQEDSDLQKSIVHDHVAFVWLPITQPSKESEEPVMGMLLERWNGVKWQYDEVEILNFLMQNYNAAWNKYAKRDQFANLFNQPVKIAAGVLLISLLFVQIPLRIIAPCEIVPKNPVMVTSPLEGIIEEIKVNPGQTVQKGDLLFSYDSKVPLDELKVAERQVDVAQAEANRANSLAFRDKKSLAEYSVLSLKLKKEKAMLDLAKYKADQLNVKSPIAGIVMLKNKDEWRGNPVQVGEKIMMIGDPEHTKVKIWIPESDNLDLHLGSEVKIVLNVSPNETYLAQLDYVSTYTSLSEKNMPSFIAEAEWKKPDNDLKIGLKGTAILYSEDVSLFYYIIRRPLSYIRSMTGI